jgi:hypothetical protein
MPALQQEGADLIDDGGALAHQSLTHPMQRLADRVGRRSWWRRSPGIGPIISSAMVAAIAAVITASPAALGSRIRAVDQGREPAAAPNRPWRSRMIWRALGNGWNSRSVACGPPGGGSRQSRRVEALLKPN